MKPRLDAQQLQDLEQHLRGTLNLTAAEVAGYVQERWGVCYTRSGMTAPLHRLESLLGARQSSRPRGAAILCREIRKTQNGHAARRCHLLQGCGPSATQPIMGSCWIKSGQEQTLQSNTGRQRLNNNGAINIATLSAEIRFDDTINTTSTIALFQQLEAGNPSASRIIVIGDNARYYTDRISVFR